MSNHDLFPVFCTSALLDMGSGRLMGFIDNVAPSASDLNPEQSVEGDLIEPKDKFYNQRTGETEVLNNLYIMDGKTKNAVQKLTVGDIGATTKLRDTETNDTLAQNMEGPTIRPIQFPQARMEKSVSAPTSSEEDKLNEALKKLHSQDPTITLRYDAETHQTLVGCQGELHLAVIKWLLQNVYQVNADFDVPRISYRETIQRTATANYRHKKQSGGAGQFAQVHLKIEPYYEGMPEPEGFSIRGKEEIDLDWGGKLIFYNCIVGGVIDSRFLPSILKGVLEVMENGPLTKSYARDVRVMVFDGKMHPVDSNDISFKIAGATAFKDAFNQANPKLLEPVFEINIKVPESMVGGVMTELQSRRAMIQGINNEDHYQILKAMIPKAELSDFSTRLRSITQGRGNFTSKFAKYESVPTHIQKELTAVNQLLEEA